MSSSWRSSLSMLDRFNIIQRLQTSLPEDQRNDALTIEQEAYHNSSTRQEYDAALNLTTPGSTPNTDVNADVEAQEGITIGTYPDCIPVAEGVTSQVYRSGKHALKVIVHRTQEPHSPHREAAILSDLRASPAPIIQLIDTFHDQHHHFVLVFPFLPLTLDDILSHGPLPSAHVQSILSDILRGLAAIHADGIIHRDIKPSAVLLNHVSGPACLSDFGTAWHPSLSLSSEPRDSKILDIGTGAYRAPEVLFANAAYDTSIDMWATGVLLAACIARPPFQSRPAHEDGSQLGLILSIFKTLGTPTPRSWPEAQAFKVSPFEMWTVFPPRAWEDILPDADGPFRDLVGRLVRYESGTRASAAEALRHACLTRRDSGGA